MYIPRAAIVGGLAVGHGLKHRDCTPKPSTDPAPAPTTDPAPPAPSPTPANTMFSIPSSWQVPTIDLPYETLRDTAQNAINQLKSQYWQDPSKLDWGWGTGTTLGAFVYKDMIASTRDNYDFVKTALESAKANNANFDPFGYNDDSMWWGTTAAYAYRAYGDQEFLGYATDVWNWVQNSQVTPEQAAAGKSPVRDAKISSECNGHSTAGAVFWRSESSDRTDNGANVITTSLFQTLSVYLAEATNDTKYIDHAKAAYEFITTVLFRDDPNIPLDGMSLGDCSANNWVFTYNTGKFIESAFGLSRLTNDDKYRQQALKTIADAITKVDNWNDLATGHIKEGMDGKPEEGNDGRQFKAIYVRALTEVARQEFQNADLHALVSSYININYNSLTKDATDGNGNYGLKWTGPFDGANLSPQMNALDLLNAGIEFNWKR
ncbi:Six-hairpin glycosidase [Auriculariales sp. MPI-PUGE-AT-0066]|nr:Six-hairpin glycosidase [Auriculariales sp. MPI-PUGE-AT-0066]